MSVYCVEKNCPICGKLFNATNKINIYCSPECAKIARREYKHKYYVANLEKLREQQRKYRKANREKLREYQREYRKANREKKREYMREYQKANREKINEYQREYRARKKGCSGGDLNA